MKKIILFCSILLFFQSHIIQAQSSDRVHHLGIEMQWYPAGYQFMATSEMSLSSKDALHGKIGYNMAHRQGFSPYNDLENGGGLGFTLGYHRYFKDGFKGLYIGGRVDFWWLTIDWEDDLASANPRMGTTKITVFQPTGELGYMYQLADTPWAIGINVSVGWEVNIKTEGDPVGEGAIGLLGVRGRYLLGNK